MPCEVSDYNLIIKLNSIKITYQAQSMCLYPASFSAYSTACTTSSGLDCQVPSETTSQLRVPIRLYSKLKLTETERRDLNAIVELNLGLVGHG